MCIYGMTFVRLYIYIERERERQRGQLNRLGGSLRSQLKTEKTFKNEQRSKDAAAKKRPNTSGVGKINNYYEDIYIPPNNNTD